MAIDLLSKPVHTIYDTEPELVALAHGDSGRCGVEGCGNPATPLVYCQDCQRPLCAKHIEVDVVDGTRRVTCPEHKGV